MPNEEEKKATPLGENGLKELEPLPEQETLALGSAEPEKADDPAEQPPPAGVLEPLSEEEVAALDTDDTNEQIEPEKESEADVPPSPPWYRRLWVVLAAKAGVVAMAAFGFFGLGLLIHLSNGLPKIQSLADYKPFVTSTVFDSEGNKIWEFYKEKREVVPIEGIPQRIKQAFLAAEDANFYEHGGLDFLGIVRAFVANLKAGGIKQGASTITMQVARSFFLSTERSYVRKAREALLARKIEKSLTKDEILWLYLNQIYLGSGAYGVAAAAEVYFHKTLPELTLAEAASIAGIPARPADYAPNTNPEASAVRRRYVLGQMLNNDFITQEEYEAAVKEWVTAYPRRLPIETWPYMAYPMEQLRIELVEKLGEDALFTDGLSIITSVLDADQRAAVAAVRGGVEDLDHSMGYRGANGRLEDEAAQLEWLEAARARITEDLTHKGIDPSTAKATLLEIGKNYEAVVTGFSSRSAEGPDGGEEPVAEVLLGPNQTGFLRLSEMAWAREPNPDVRPDDEGIRNLEDALAIGDAIEVRILSAKAQASSEGIPIEKTGKGASLPAEGSSETEPRDNTTKEESDQPAPFPEFSYEVALYQTPEVQGALLALNPNTGQIHAVVGGYDYATSKFNRAVQALRQPGSAFKPIIFSRALINGYTPSSTILDAPVTYQGATDEEVWKPKNYVDRFTGEVTLREALTRSINTIPIKILMDLGIDSTIRYAHELGIQSELTPDPTLALGSSSVTLMDLCRAYAVFANGGYRIEPTLIERVENSRGELLLERKDPWHPSGMENDAAEDPALASLAPPGIGGLLGYGALDMAARDGDGAPQREERVGRIETLSPQAAAAGQVLSSAAAYVMTNLLSNVILHGTGHRAVALRRPAAGKTGTSNDNIDNWFIGYTPDLLAGIWLGYDDRRTLGRFHAGGNTAAPAWLDFMQNALEGKPIKNFPVPGGVVFYSIDAKTGKLARPESGGTVFQAFLDGSEPTEFAREEGELRVEDFFQIDESLQAESKRTSSSGAN